MVTNIGDSSNYTFVISDHVTPASGTYAWYFTPQKVQMLWSTPATVQQQIELGINIASLLGKLIVTLNCKDIPIRPVASTAFAEFEKLKQALFYWASGNAGATTGGFLLYLSAKDNTGNIWSKIAAYETPTTLATFRTKIMENITFEPQPDASYNITGAKFSNYVNIEELA